MLIHDKFYGEGESDYYKFHDITKQLSKRQNVEFALYSAKDVFHLVDKENKEVAKTCIDLVGKWLIDENSVTSEDIRDAADAASGVAANATWIATNAAADAVCAVSYAANAAADAVYATSDAAAGWSAYSIYAAVDAVSAYNNKRNEYLVIANSYLTRTNINCPNYEIEGKILYLIDELDENIIIQKDKYYVNMNEIERCPEYGFDTQQELLNELFNSKCLFWEFARNWLDNLYQEGTQC